MSLGGERAPGPSFLSCRPQCPRAVGCGRNEPCVVSCAASRVIIYPPPVVVTFPGPIVSTCPQEAVVGGSVVGGSVVGSSVVGSSVAGSSVAGSSVVGSSVVGNSVAGSSVALRGAGPTPLTAEIPRPEPGPERRSAPKKRGPRRCSYIFASNWIHPCSRAGSRRSQESGGKDAGKGEPETENADAPNEDKEPSEKPRGEATPEGLVGSCSPSAADLPLSP